MGRSMEELNVEEIIEETSAEDAVSAETSEDKAAAEENVCEDSPVRKGSALKLIGAFAAGFAACLAVFAVVIYVAHLGRFVLEEDYKFYNDVTDRFGKYYVIMEMIDNDPLLDKNPVDITDEYLKKLAEDLDDPYAEYFTPKEFTEYKMKFEGDYVGLGILVGATDEGLRVEEVYENCPAFKAGMQKGDLILRVDDVVPADLDDAVSRMKGKAGTSVTVTVDRGGKEIDLKMKRESIDIESVGYAVSEDDPKVGYIRVALFAEDTAREFRDAVKELQGKGCDKFILDLRSNGGGLTDVSISMADYLLPECTIMTEVSKDGTEKVYTSNAGTAELDLVILVDQNTASASEILTAAVKENNAGTVIGTRTYGKGVTQITREFKDGSAIKMTVTEYLTPKGNHVQGEGIQPDIEASEEDILDKALEELAK